MNYINQIFGRRLVIKNECEKSDWEKLGLRVPTRPDRYLLTKCLNCGNILPCEISNLKRQPPKRCVFCSNIGNHSNVDTNTNAWVVYDSYAVCNVNYGNEVVSFYIDKQKYDDAKKYVWRISKKKQKYYVISGSFKKGTAIYLHDFVYGKHADGLEIDHIDGNSLNNRISNLRVVTHQGNVDNIRATRIDNQIGIRGVVYNKAGRSYHVDFHFHGKRFYTKEWNTISEAVWCRKCFEDYFGLELVVNNPIAKEYDVLDDVTKHSIQQYVQNIILGNER